VGVSAYARRIHFVIPRGEAYPESRKPGSKIMRKITDNLFISDKHSRWENDRHDFFWEGIVFVRGILSGSKSLDYFSKVIERQGLESACHTLSGTFFLVVRDKSTGIFNCLIDNSGLFQAYYSKNRVSTSFLHLAKMENLTAADLDRRAVVEFIHLGNIFFNRTFFDSIKKVDGNQILRSDSSGNITILPKKLPPLFDEPPAETLLDIFAGISKSIGNRKVSIDLTGGMDSRILVVIFNQLGLKFETGVYGREDHPDVIISREVSGKLGINHMAVDYSPDNLDYQLEEAFQDCDGLSDPVLDIITLKLQKERRAKKFDLVICAGGGEIFDDFFWLQDYPFYNSRKVHLKRLFEFRFRPYATTPHGLFTKKYAKISKNLAKYFVIDLAPRILETNTKTYADIFASVRWKEVLGMSMIRYKQIIQYYSPFMEYDVIRLAVNLPIKQRTNSRFLRELLRKVNPEIAALPLLGRNYLWLMKYSFILGGGKYYFFKTGQYLIRKFGASISKLLLPIMKTPQLTEKIQALPVLEEYTGLLKDAGILDWKVNLDSINLPFLGRYISTAKLIKYLNNLNQDCCFLVSIQIYAGNSG